MNPVSEPVDLLILGGGLSGLLTAWFRLIEHPTERVVVLEAAPKPAGNHTWSFNLSDIPPALLLHIQQMIVHRWDGYEVCFPAFRRRVESVYATGNSASLLAAMAPVLSTGQLDIWTNTPVARAEPELVHLGDGSRIRARAVVDARGGLPGDFMQLAYQKFVGLTVRTQKPHGLSEPVLMDATVPQLDGYRFLYCLPLSETGLLVEDTYYADAPHLNAVICQRRVQHYARQHGWAIAEVLRSEQGVLPIALSNDVSAALRAESGRAPKIGLAGGLFHATTGYSLPDAVRLAAAIARIPDLNAENLAATVAHYRRQHGRRGAFFRRLNRMLFCAAEPHQRYKVLQHFFQLDDDLIRRFFAGSLKPLDKARILCGRPPVPLRPALNVISEQRYKRQWHAAT